MAPSKDPMSEQRERELLGKLDSIGGWVAEAEAIFHLGEGAVVELLELEADGLIESRTEFTLTHRGEAVARAAS